MSIGFIVVKKFAQTLLHTIYLPLLLDNNFVESLNGLS